jgi:LPXTG-site transpeptidase (sortase) family protein
MSRQMSSHRMMVRLIWMLIIFVLLGFQGAGGALASSPPAAALKDYQESPAQASAGTIGLGAIQTNSLVASDAAFLDEFGWSVAVSGDTIVIGARNHDPIVGDKILGSAGAVYVFVRSGNDWIQDAKLLPNDPQTGGAFGVSVAIDDGTILVGASGYDVKKESDVGAAYVFVRQGGAWKQQARLTPSDGDAGDSFGVSVALNGDTAVIGADSKDTGMLPDAGAAYVFRRSGKTWWEQARLVDLDGEPGDYFGNAVAIDNNLIVVGATEANPLGLRGPGQAFVFQKSGSSWTQAAELAAEDGRSGDFFGESVAISGETIVVGANMKDPDLGSGRITSAGAAYVFEPRNGSWQQQAILTAKDARPFDHFGRSVAISGGQIIVGASDKERFGTSRVGAAYLFTRQGRDWEAGSIVAATDASADDAFGQSVALWQDTLIIGANGRDPLSITKAGEAFVYRVAQVILPETGFAPGRITRLPARPEGAAYHSLGDLWLEIPSQNVGTPIVGVQKGNSGWDVTWLNDQAGYLEGTAFPTWKGNTGIAAHVTLPNGQPGPFAGLQKLAWGDLVVIHAFGQTYTYEIRVVKKVRPEDLSVLKHEELDWVTLITCDDYDPSAEGYPWRMVVRAVLVKVEG